MTVTLLLLN